MNPIARLAAVAVVAAVAIGGSLYLIGKGPAGPGSQPTPALTAAPTPTPLMAGPLAIGTYVGPTHQVADILAMLNADTELTPSERTTLFGESLAIKDKSTWSASIEVRGGQWTQRQTTDGDTVIGSLARYAFPDDQNVVLTDSVDGGITTFELTVDGDSFTLRRTSPPADSMDAFISKIIFESGPFTLVR